MTSIRAAFTSVKNFITSLTQQQQQEEVSNAEGYQQQQTSRFGRVLFSSGTTRKRPGTFFEPEITNDEDDIPSGSSPFKCNIDNPRAKRIRIDCENRELHSIMSSRQGELMSRGRGRGRYLTRGSGVPPNIPGLTKQPWEFQFPNSSKEERLKMGNVICGDSRMASSAGASSSKDVEVITLDDEQPCSSKSLVSHTQKGSTTATTSKQSQFPVKKLTSPMKGTRQRDSNRFSKCLTAIGQKLYGHRSSPVCLKEKEKYKQLLMNFNILNNSGMYQSSSSALTKSKVPKPHLQVMYRNFRPSPTQGAVTIRDNNGQAFLSSKNDFLSPADRSALVPLPRLYSTPQDLRPLPASPKTKAITYETEPETIDLEEPCSSSKIVSCISPITPFPSRSTHASSTPVKSMMSFTNLEDALNKSTLPEELDTFDESETGILALEDSQKNEEEDDISILAEKIVNKSRSKSVNTLALEQSSCPYVEKQWLDNSKSSYRENQKYRDQRIQEESETLKILRTESTLDKDLEERIRKKLTLTEIIVLEEQPETLPELTQDMMRLINYAKMRGNDSEVLAEVRLSKDTIAITRGDVRTLAPMQWLNDNVINTYMGLILLRSKRDDLPSVYTFQTFFYPKLLKEGYSNQLKRWTRKDDIFAHDLIILPIHLGLHWCLACVDLRHKTIKYYDSLNGNNDRCLNVLLEYLSREMKERKQSILNKDEWKLENVKGIPQQLNGSDCGMFSCKFAEYLSRDANFTFTQNDMPYYRDRMIYELIKSNLMSP